MQASRHLARADAAQPRHRPVTGTPAGDLTQAEWDLLTAALDLARTGETAQLQTWIEAGVPVNLSSSRGDSLLMLAAYHAHTDTVEMLLDHGADTSRTNDNGQTALGAAVFRQADRSVRALLSAGADPHLGQRSAVSIATFFRLTAMQQLLGEPGPADGGAAPHST